MASIYKYDLNDEVDDNTFLAKSRPNYNKPSSATADFERKQQLLLLQKDKLEESCLQSTKNSIMLINESEQIGIKTGSELLEQREKLTRVNNDLDTIAGVSRQSQKNINAMNSGIGSFLFNGLKSMFKSSKEKDKQENNQPNKLTSSQSANNFNDDNHLNNTINKLRSNSTQYEGNHLPNRPETIFENKVQEPKKKGFDSQLDENLLVMQSGISRLKNLALGLGQEIDSQDELLEAITNKADKTNTTIKVQNKQMLKQLGK